MNLRAGTDTTSVVHTTWLTGAEWAAVLRIGLGLWWLESFRHKNFEAWQRVVAPGDPMSSRLLMHPLKAEAGGDPFHAGGKHWTSQNDPEWQTLAAWVRGQTGSK